MNRDGILSGDSPLVPVVSLAAASALVTQTAVGWWPVLALWLLVALAVAAWWLRPHVQAVSQEALCVADRVDLDQLFSRSVAREQVVARDEQAATSEH